MGAFAVFFFTLFFLAIGFLLLWNGNSLQGHCCSTTDDSGVCSSKTSKIECGEDCKWQYWNCDGPFPWQSKYNGPGHNTVPPGPVPPGPVPPGPIPPGPITICNETTQDSCPNGYKKSTECDGNLGSCCIPLTCSDVYNETKLKKDPTATKNDCPKHMKFLEAAASTSCGDKCTSDICCTPIITCDDYNCPDSQQIPSDPNALCVGKSGCEEHECGCIDQNNEGTTCGDWVENNNLEKSACPIFKHLVNDKPCPDNEPCTRDHCCEPDGGICCPDSTKDYKPIDNISWFMNETCINETNESDCTKNTGCTWKSGGTTCNFYQCNNKGNACYNRIREYGKELKYYMQSDDYDNLIKPGRAIYNSFEDCANDCCS